MGSTVIESEYPITFRHIDAEELGRCLRLRQSMEIIGMKRVGISNFLRFFLNHNGIQDKYIKDDKKHLFIAVDLNDLIERELFPFWTLTLKRIVDGVEQSAIPEEIKNRIQTLFLGSIQSQDLFMLIDNVRRALIMLSQHDIYPTLFFLRFDRMQDAFTVSFFDNLKGIRDATNEKVAYVFTSYRRLDEVFPSAKPSLSALSQAYYFKPAKDVDMKTVYEIYKKRNAVAFSQEHEKKLFKIVGGNVQYMQLAMIVLSELHSRKTLTPEELLPILIDDERITLQSEELWESLFAEEKKSLLKAAKGGLFNTAEAKYLWDTGFIYKKEEGLALFSPLISFHLLHEDVDGNQKKEAVHLTRKENMLYSLLEKKIGEICERDEIIEIVWPEYREFGVSDWAIDRLVARVRVKLRKQKSQYEIVTVRTRGYKLSTPVS